MEGYSGTPLARKLGVKEGFNILLINQPEYYKDLFKDFPETAIESKKPESEKVDFIHVFCKSVNDMQHQLPKLKLMQKKME